MTRVSPWRRPSIDVSFTAGGCCCGKVSAGVPPHHHYHYIHIHVLTKSTRIITYILSLHCTSPWYLSHSRCQRSLCISYSLTSWNWTCVWCLPELLSGCGASSLPYAASPASTPSGFPPMTTSTTLSTTSWRIYWRSLILWLWVDNEVSASNNIIWMWTLSQALGLYRLCQLPTSKNHV